MARAQPRLLTRTPAHLAATLTRRRRLTAPGSSGPNRAASAVVEVVGGAVIFGTVGTVTALIPAGSPVSFGAVRIAVGAIAMTGYVLARGRRARAEFAAMFRSPMIWLCALGATGYQPTFFGAVSLSGVPVGTLVAAGSAPAVTGLLAWITLRERPTRAWFVATAICVAGLGLLTGLGDGSGSPLGVALGLGAALSLATYTVAARQLLVRGASVLPLLAATYLIGSVVMVPVGAVAGLHWLATPTGVAVALWLGVMTMGVANILYARGVSQLGGPVTATMNLADPLTATLLGVALLGQSLGPIAWVGVAGLLTGLVLQGRSARARPGTTGDGLTV